MPRIIKNINGTMGVAAGAVSNSDIPNKARYHALFAVLSATVGGDPIDSANDAAESLRLSVNGALMWDLKPAELKGFGAFHKLNVPADTLPFYFSEPTRASVLGEEATAWDLFAQSKATLEIKWKEGLVNPALKLKAALDYSRNEAIGIDGQKRYYNSVFKILPKTWNYGAGVANIMDILPTSPIQRIIWLPSAGVVTNLEVWRDGELIFEATRDENKRLLADYDLDAEAFGAGAFTYAPDYEQQITSPLVAANALEFRVTLSEPCTLRALIVRRVPAFA